MHSNSKIKYYNQLNVIICKANNVNYLVLAFKVIS